MANTSQILGAALLTIPVAAIMAARGRRAGLVTAYAIGTIGAGLAILAAVANSFPLLLLGTTLVGAATTANSQARYAAVDLAEPHRRGRQLSLVVWATTIGSVLGPNMIGPGAWVAEQIGVPALAGAWVFSAVGFILAAVFLATRLRPDPLVTARNLESPTAGTGVLRGSVARGLRLIPSNPAALLGTVALTGGHATMVAVMVMTPLHMRHGDAEVEVIGFVISVHILGMFGLSPVSGWLTDRYGARRVVFLGVALLVLACALAATSAAGWSFGLLAGLFVLGLGWSCTMVAGSGLIAGSVSVADRSSVQGAADLVMGLSAAAAGALAGVVVHVWSYAWLAAGGACLALALGAFTGLRGRLVSLDG